MNACRLFIISYHCSQLLRIFISTFVYPFYQLDCLANNLLIIFVSWQTLLGLMGFARISVEDDKFLIETLFLPVVFFQLSLSLTSVLKHYSFQYTNQKRQGRRLKLMRGTLIVMTFVFALGTILSMCYEPNLEVSFILKSSKYSGLILEPNYYLFL